MADEHSEGEAKPWSETLWGQLRELRARFLRGAPGPEYWQDEGLVRAYDQTFGVRIRWKWEAVLQELQERGFKGGLRVLDLGCGSGVAGRAYFTAFGVAPGSSLWLMDRSKLARACARQLVDEEFRGRPGPKVLEVETLPAEPFDVVLVSHVLGELGDEILARWWPVLERAGAILWVEPGTPELSRRLIGLRERLLAHFAPLAPCPRDRPCPLAQGNDPRAWCHLFAPPAPEAFTSRHWRRFSEELEIDLRALPYTYVAMVRRKGAPPSEEQPPPPPTGERAIARPLGRPKPEKGRVLLDACLGDEVLRLRLLQRDEPALAKRLADPRPFHGLLSIERAKDRILRASPLPPDGERRER